MILEGEGLGGVVSILLCLCPCNEESNCTGTEMSSNGFQNTLYTVIRSTA